MINPVHKAKHFFEQFNEKYPMATRISSQSVHLPSGTGLTEENIEYIIKAVHEYF